MLRGEKNKWKENKMFWLLEADIISQISWEEPTGLGCVNGDLLWGYSKASSLKFCYSN